MKKAIIILFVLGLVAVLSSCTYNKENLPEPIADTTPNPNPTPSPDPSPSPSNDITYTSHVKSYIDNNCVGCHGSSGGVTLQTYAQVKAQADAGRILARAINGSGNGPMPPSGLMPQATLDTLQMWLDQGALE